MVGEKKRGGGWMIAHKKGEIPCYKKGDRNRRAVLTIQL